MDIDFHKNACHNFSSIALVYVRNVYHIIISIEIIFMFFHGSRNVNPHNFPELFQKEIL